MKHGQSTKIRKSEGIYFRIMQIRQEMQEMEKIYLELEEELDKLNKQIK